ncbi:Copia protein [Symbiodinium microadriaticum]|uniref:Copia protein n=1 Tax=Symbiodinium microadriaticum TaxID=2951 RepID=A0A1Q9BY35_SYMMI|nr:Copia protein [Symbiodinium microadriaticum]
MLESRQGFWLMGSKQLRLRSYFSVGLIGGTRAERGGVDVALGGVFSEKNESSHGLYGKEQVMAEVSKQVRLAMEAHNREYRMLERENEMAIFQEPEEAVPIVEMRLVGNLMEDYLEASEGFEEMLLIIVKEMFKEERRSLVMEVSLCLATAGLMNDAGKNQVLKGMGMFIRGPSTDPIGMLAQGMMQLQTAMTASLSRANSEVEVVKPGITELPKLADLTETSCLDIGDWLHALECPMGDISNTSSVWWRGILASLDAYYKAYLESSNMGKLALKVENFASPLVKEPRWSRVDKRATSMLLACVPEAVRSEVLAMRLTGTLQVLGRIMVLYRPGSSAERQQILKALEGPTPSNNAPEAVEQLRRWARWLRRSEDVGLKSPDASILLRGLDNLVRKPLQEHAEIAFRVNILRYQLEVDTKPTQAAIMNLHSTLLSEFEQVAFKGRGKAGTNVATMKGLSMPTTTSTPSTTPNHGAGGDAEGAKGKGSPCKFFLTDNGCRRGSSCKFSHEVDKRQRQGRCWTCGSKQHVSKQCPTKDKNPPKSPPRTSPNTPKAEAGGVPQSSLASITQEPDPPLHSTTSSTTSGGPTTTMPGENSVDTQVREMLKEANTVLKELRQLKMLTVKEITAVATESGCNPDDGRTGLLDSGASHAFRMAEESEIDGASAVQVQLANGQQITLAQNEAGTLLARKSAKVDDTTPIVPLGALVGDLGCELRWNRRGLQIDHPRHGALKPRVVGNCPVLGEAQALTLIRELEEKKLEELQKKTVVTQRAIWSWDAGKPWMECLENVLTTGTRASQLLALEAQGSPFVGVEADVKAKIAEEVVFDDVAGWKYLKALPFSRAKRRQLMERPWIVNLFSGPGTATPEFKCLENGGVLVEVDITKSKAFDLRRPSGTYRTLLWAAATGRVRGVLASPPVRSQMDEELIAKAMWISLVARGATSWHCKHPAFIMFEGEKLLQQMRSEELKGVSKSLRKAWGVFQEVLGLDYVESKMMTNLDYDAVLKDPTSKEGRWTEQFKVATAEAVTRWWKEPDARQLGKWLARMDTKDGVFLSALSARQLQEWKEHVRNNHIPFHRGCKTCVESSATGKQHRRIKSPSGYCLSLDICGPFRERGETPDHMDYRYALVGAYLLPTFATESNENKAAESSENKATESSENKAAESNENKAAESNENKAAESNENKAGGSSGHESDVFEPKAIPDIEGGVGALDEHDDKVLIDEVIEGNAVVADDDDPSLPKGMTQEEFETVFKEVQGITGYKVIYVSRPLRTRLSKEVLAAAQDIFLRLRAEGLPILRVHSDRARELRAVALKRWFLERGAYSTYTEGQTPQANGRAEAAVRYVKTQAKKLLTTSGLPMSTWPLAMSYATWAQRQKVLYPSKEILPFGVGVHVRAKVYGTGGRYDLTSRWTRGRYVGPSSDVNDGSVIFLDKRSYLTTVQMRPGLIEAEREVDLGTYEAILATPSTRLRMKTNLPVLDDEPLQDDPGEGAGQDSEADPNHPMEEYARAILREDVVLRDYIESLFAMLPMDGNKPKRFGKLSEEEETWATGAYVHGGVVGVLANTKKFPTVTKVLVRYLRQECPGFHFNNIVLMKDIKAEWHKDAHNVGENAVLPLSDFCGGDILVKRDGQVSRLEVSKGPQFFDPHHEHRTEECTRGRYLLLVGYSIRDSGKLKEGDVAFLEDLGFQWIPHRVRQPGDEGPKQLKMMKVELDDAKRVGLLQGEPPNQGNSPMPSTAKAMSTNEFLHVVQDLDVAIQDMEQRAERLRLLLEEEEILAEQAGRMGQSIRDELGGARDQVCQFLDGVNHHLEQFKEMRDVRFLRAARVVEGEQAAVDYEQLLESLEGDLDVIHTVPLDQVKKVVHKWATAIRKEVRSLFETGTLSAITAEEARSLEAKKELKIVPSKCVFTLKPPSSPGERCRRKCRLVLCGNYIGKDGLEADLYASGTSSEAMRIALIIAASRRWKGAIADITSAFLQAFWPASMPRYGIIPPRVVQDLPDDEKAGEVEGSVWVVQRPLYGLRESPMIWAEHRNKELRRLTVAHGKRRLRLKPLTSEPELWLIWDESAQELCGILVVYVDDLMYLAEEETIEVMHAEIRSLWPTSTLEWLNQEKSVRYLGVEIKATPDGSYSINQQAYITELLRAHNLHSATHTQLPVPKEWIDNVEQGREAEEEFCERDLRRGQKAVGECLWLAMKSRPDILFAVNHMASQVSKRPLHVARVGERLLAYLAGTADLSLVLSPGEETTRREIVCYTDASFSPYGEKSFGAAVIVLGKGPVAWKAGRQSFVTLSTMEAELYAASQGYSLLLSTAAIVDELQPGVYDRVLAVDNQSTVSMCAGGPGSQRTRHLKVRAEAIREAVAEHNLIIRYTPGEEQLADLATKLVPRERLWYLLRLWGFATSGLERVMNLLRLQMIAVVVALTSLVGPVDGAHHGVKKGFAVSGMDEILFLATLMCIAAIGLWELFKWSSRALWRQLKNCKRQSKLAKVREIAAQAAKEAVREEEDKKRPRARDKEEY